MESDEPLVGCDYHTYNNTASLPVGASECILFSRASRVDETWKPEICKFELNPMYLASSSELWLEIDISVQQSFLQPLVY